MTAGVAGIARIERDRPAEEGERRIVRFPRGVREKHDARGADRAALVLARFAADQRVDAVTLQQAERGVKPAPLRRDEELPHDPAVVVLVEMESMSLAERGADIFAGDRNSDTHGRDLLVVLARILTTAA